MSLTRRAVPWARWSLLALAGHAGCAGAAEGSRHAVYRVNGVRFDVVTLELAGDARRIAEALADDWHADGAARPRLQRRGDAWIVGRQRGTLHETVELRDGHGRRVVDGRVATVDLARPPREPSAAPFRLPPGVRSLQVIEDVGAAGRPVVFVMASRVGVEATWTRLQGALEDAGLSTSAQAGAAGDGHAVIHVFGAARPGLSVDGVIRAHAEGARVVVVQRWLPRGLPDARR
jgi:hypothetical protein